MWILRRITEGVKITLISLNWGWIKSNSHLIQS
jgi:hypothetical protein